MITKLPKTPKQILLYVVVFLFFLAFAVITDNKFNKIFQEQYDKAVEITRADSVNLMVTNTWSNRGFSSFNDSLYILSFKMNQPNLKIIDRHKLKRPFYLKKNANNDTIWVIGNKKERYFWVFRKDSD